MIKIFSFPFSCIWLRKATTPTILQLSDTECGTAALAMILAYFKLYVPLEVLREQCGATRDGCKATTLLKVAKHYGLGAEAYSINLDNIAKLNHPVIAYWKFSHYIVVNRMVKNKVFINDPAIGPTILSMSEFSQGFTGVILTFSNSKKIKRIRKKNTGTTFMGEWFKLNLKEIGIISGLVGLTCLIPTTESILPKLVVNEAHFRESSLPYSIILSGYFIILFIALNASILLVWEQFKLFTFKSINKCSKIFNHTLQLPLVFYSLRQKSEIINLLAQAEHVLTTLCKNSLQILSLILLAILCLVAMAYVCKPLICLSLISTLIMLIHTYIFSKKKLNFEKYALAKLGKKQAHEVMSIKNIETVKACGFEKMLFKKWQYHFYQSLKIKMRNFRLEQLQISTAHLIDYISCIAIIISGYQLMLNKNINLSHLLGYYSLHCFFKIQLHKAYLCINEIITIRAVQERIQGIENYKHDYRYTLSNFSRPTDQTELAIECREVNYTYHHLDKNIIQQLSLNIRHHQKIAIVGSTGSGKSTLAKLMSGLYLPSSGKINLCGVSTKKLSFEHLQNMIAYVGQEITLFSGTLIDNLTFWQNNASEQLIETALQTCCLTELVKKRGLQAIVEENGHNFSGGERQRIELARALIQNTPILIIDEGTSALDKQTEQHVLSQLMKTKKTILFITHRQHTLSYVDQVFYMDKGRINKAEAKNDAVKSNCNTSLTYHAS